MSSAAEITEDLYRRLTNRHIKSGTVILFEVGDGAGFGNSGWTDAIAMDIWPSKGLRLYGYEVKATRSDWLRELAETRKNESWQACVHEWYIVAPKDIVKLDELPTDWGLMVPRGADGLRIAKRSERPAPLPVTIEMVAAVFRNASQVRDGLTVQERNRLEGQISALHEGRHAEIKKQRDQLRRELKTLKDALANDWGDDLDSLQARARALRELGSKRLLDNLKYARNTLSVTAKQLQDAEEKLRGKLAELAP